MNLKDIMNFNNFVVVGNTTDTSKYAAKIKLGLEKASYNVCGVYKEFETINDVPFDIDVLDLCINPIKGLELLKNNNKKIKVVVIQPGAESIEIKNYLDENQIEYIEGCLLVGLSLYKK